MKSFPIVLPGSRGVTTVIGMVALQDDVANQMAEVAIQTRKGFTLNVTINVDKREIQEFLISNLAIMGKGGEG